MNLKTPVLRDREWLDYLRTQPCICLGISGESEPCHIGTAGRGLKSPDNEALPLHYSVHRDCHQYGEMSILRKYLPDDVLRAALRAYAREKYREWKESR